jgi:antitoxin ParD1/3/4
LNSGDYASARELVRDALRVLKRDREIEREKIDVLRRKLDVGIGQADRRDFSDRCEEEITASVLSENDE